MRARGEKMHGAAMTFVRWPDAACGDRSEGGRRRQGYVVGLISSSLSSPRHTLQWAAKFNRKLVKGSPGGGAYAFGEIVGRVALLREFCSPLWARPRGWRKLVPPLLEDKTMITEKYFLRHSLGIQQFSGNGELGSVYWLPGLVNPADGMTQV